jgi:succinate dehydrogenase / fumarate reductase cytochrome b subunit
MRRFAASRHEKALKSLIVAITLGSSMPEAVKKPRPEFRNIGIGDLMKYRLPLAGKLSILHRASGLLLFVLLPFSLYLFQQSLTSEYSFGMLKGFASNIIVKLIILVLAWAFLFHFCAGLRFLLQDTHRAVSKQGGKTSAGVAMVVSTVLAIGVALKLFGVF